MGESIAPLTRSCGGKIDLCLFFGVPCFGGGIHRRTISPICVSGIGKLILQCTAARAGRRSWMRRILVGETTDGTSLLLMRCMSQRQKREVRNQRGFGDLLGTFQSIEKYPVGDRHQLPLRWCCPAAQRHGQSPSQPTADSPLKVNWAKPKRRRPGPLHKGAFSVRC